MADSLSTGVTAVPASFSLSEGWSLLAKARQGTGRDARQHAARLVAHLRPRAFALAYRLLQDQALAEDALQEAFIRLWRSQASDQGRAQLGTYFHHIVANESLRLLRRGGRELSWSPDELVELIDQRDEPQATEAPGFDPDVLEAAIAGLPDRQRVALVLWAYEGASPAEVARALGLSPNAAHQLLHRAKQSLKAALSTGQTT